MSAGASPPSIELTPPGSFPNAAIAFDSDRSGDFDIYVMNQDGTETVAITRTPAVDEVPAWSPDGTRLAWARAPRHSPFAHDIYIADAIGDGLVRATKNAANDTEPAWSPDMTRLAFSSGRTGGGDIYIQSLNGSSLTRLTRGPAFDAKPAWSPDGTTIAFNRTDPTMLKTSISVVNVDGDGLVALTQGDGFDHDPDSDGSRILFVSDAGQQ